MYWNIYPERHGALWGALEAVHPQNGGLSVLRGLHRRGCFPRIGASEPRLGFFDPSHNIDPQELPDEQALLELQADYALNAGTVAVHDVMLPHAVSPSRSSSFAFSTNKTSGSHLDN